MVSTPCSVEGCGRKHKAKGLCGLHYNRKLRRENPDIMARQREYDRRRRLDPERRDYINRYRREWRKDPAVRERERGQSREYRGRPEVQEKRRLYRREYRKRPEVRARRNARRMRPEVRERRRQQRREYRKRRAPEVRERRAEHKAQRRRDLGKGYRKVATLDALHAAQDGRCGICGEPLPDDYRDGSKVHVDHRWPQVEAQQLGSLGVAAVHRKDNLQLAHARCNQSKGAQT